MSKSKQKLINKIRSLLLLEADKEINQIINTSKMRINGITSKKFMEKNKTEYVISINNGIIYDCYKLPKNEEIQCNILGKYCINYNLELQKYQKIKENKIDLASKKNLYPHNLNKNVCLFRKKNQNKSVKENINFLKRMSYFLKNPIKERIKYRKSTDNISSKLKHSHINNSGSVPKIKFFPIKKKSTKNIKRYIANLKFNNNFIKKIYNNYRVEGGLDFS